MKSKFLIGMAALSLAASCQTQPNTANSQASAFPYVIPKEKPDMQLSAAMSRVYDEFGVATPQENELFTNFKYTEIKGLEYSNHDGTVTRRDPTRIVKANGKYYMWYTLRNTKTPPMGADKANDTIPSVDWDLCDIGYATSTDGFTWEEQGVAVPRPAKPTVGYRSVATPDILVWKGKYYLYDQAFSEISGKQGEDCPVAMSYADSPDGPWTPLNKIVIPNGAPGEWDQFAIHDPLPIVYKDKIYLYYKSDYNRTSNSPEGKRLTVRSTGLAIADNPFGPFVKSPLNPVLNSGHETNMCRFKEGIAAVMAKDGHEVNTIQYAADGVNFHVASHCEMPPIAGGFYDPDAFTNTNYARGVTWGVSHMNIWNPSRSIIVRFDCDLSLDVDNQVIKKNRGVQYPLDELFKRGLNAEQREEIVKRAKEDLAK